MRIGWIEQVPCSSADELDLLSARRGITNSDDA